MAHATNRQPLLISIEHFSIQNISEYWGREREREKNSCRLFKGLIH